MQPLAALQWRLGALHMRLHWVWVAPQPGIAELEVGLWEVGSVLAFGLGLGRVSEPGWPTACLSDPVISWGARDPQPSSSNSNCLASSPPAGLFIHLPLSFLPSLCLPITCTLCYLQGCTTTSCLRMCREGGVPAQGTLAGTLPLRTLTPRSRLGTRQLPLPQPRCRPGRSCSRCRSGLGRWLQGLQAPAGPVSSRRSPLDG